MTFKEFVAECEMYEHSKEHYELMKECSELNIINQYLSDIAFVERQTPLIESDSIVLTEGYFIESSNSDVESIMEAAENKTKGIFAKIAKGFRRIIDAFISFCKMIGQKFDSFKTKAKELLKKLRNKIFNKKDAEAFLKIKKECEAKSNLLSYTTYLKLEMKEPKDIKFEPAVSAKDADEIKKMFDLLLGDPILAQYVGNGTAGAIDIKELGSIAKALANAKSPADIQNALDRLKNANKDAAKDGIKVDITNAAINDTIASLQMFATAIERMYKDGGGYTPTAKVAMTDEQKEYRPGYFINNGVYQTYNEVYKITNAAIANTIKLYNAFSQYKEYGIQSLFKATSSESYNYVDDQQEQANEL